MDYLPSNIVHWQPHTSTMLSDHASVHQFCSPPYTNRVPHSVLIQSKSRGPQPQSQNRAVCVVKPETKKKASSSACRSVNVVKTSTRQLFNTTWK